MTSHTIGQGEGHKCHHCPASFSTRSVLSVHMRDAHGDKYQTKKDTAAATNGQGKQPKSANSNSDHFQISGMTPEITMKRCVLP
jgi:hypothetical protein